MSFQEVIAIPDVGSDSLFRGGKISGPMPEFYSILYLPQSQYTDFSDWFISVLENSTIDFAVIPLIMWFLMTYVSTEGSANANMYLQSL